MPTIDRSLCVLDADLGGYSGVVQLVGRRFDVFVKAWAGDWVAAWDKADQGVELFLSRPDEIEAAVASQLAPELDHWTAEPLSVAEITQRVAGHPRHGCRRPECLREFRVTVLRRPGAGAGPPRGGRPLPGRAGVRRVGGVAPSQALQKTGGRMFAF